MQGYCTKDGASTRTVYALERVWNKQNYTGTAVIEKAGNNNAGAITQIMPWLVLTFIFAFSTCFQCTRLRVTEEDVDESDSNTEWIRTRQKYRKEGYILNEGWKLFHLGDVFKFINDQSYDYDPRKKDFWRWLEYALTSPLQITLIAMFIFVLDRSTIMNLWGLQGALVLLGALNEYYIDKVWKAIIKGRKSDANQSITIEWRQKYPQYNANNLEKHGVLEVNGAQFIFCSQNHPVIELLRQNAEMLKGLLQDLETKYDSQETVTGPVMLNALQSRLALQAKRPSGKVSPLERMDHCRKALERLDSAGWKRSYHQRLFHDDFLVRCVCLGDYERGIHA